MDIDSRIKLKGWLERKYYTRSSVDEGNASVVIKSGILDSEGIDIHTDGIVEKNEKDFDMCIVSGYNYLSYVNSVKSIKIPKIQESLYTATRLPFGSTGSLRAP